MYRVLYILIVPHMILASQHNMIVPSISHSKQQTPQTPLSRDILVSPENNITPISRDTQNKIKLTFPQNFEINVDNINVIMQTVQGFVFTEYLAYNPKTNAPEMRLLCSNVLLQDGTEMSLQNTNY
jgi:hypothetical protein